MFPFVSLSLAGAGSVAHSRTSSVGEAGAGYLPMAPGHEPLAGLISASSGSLCSGTPSTDPRFRYVFYSSFIFRLFLSTTKNCSETHN